MANWTLAKERAFGVHVHSLYVHNPYPNPNPNPNVSSRLHALFVVMDVGDPWAEQRGDERTQGGLHTFAAHPRGTPSRHEELDTHHKCLGTHKQSTPRAGEGLPAGAARLGRAALQNHLFELQDARTAP